MNIIIVGAGLAGCTLARLFAENGDTVTIFEKNNYVGGNCRDYVNNIGILVHEFGPHIFHTSDEEVWKFVNRFSYFVNYKHRVLVDIEKNLLPFPINLESISALFPDDFDNFIKEIKAKNFYGKSVPIVTLLNDLSNETNRKIIKYIYDNVYANYSSKMWGLSIEKIDKKILQRVTVNLNYDWNYFPNDKYCGLPFDGYTEMLLKMIDHQNINILLNVDANNLFRFEDDSVKFWNKEFDIIVYCGSVDRLLNYKHGKLQYRSLNIVFESYKTNHYQDAVIVNYPSDPKLTRICEYKYFNNQVADNVTTISKEYPGKYDINSKEFNHPFYPLSDENSKKIYLKYYDELSKYNNLYLLGRLAQYRYFDMDDTIRAAIDLFNKLK